MTKCIKVNLRKQKRPVYKRKSVYVCHGTYVNTCIYHVVAVVLSEILLGMALLFLRVFQSNFGNSSLRYSLIGDDELNNFFSIDPVSAVVRLASSIASDSNTQYRVGQHWPIITTQNNVKENTNKQQQQNTKQTNLIVSIIKILILEENANKKSMCGVSVGLSLS